MGGVTDFFVGSGENLKLKTLKTLGKAKRRNNDVFRSSYLRG